MQSFSASTATGEPAIVRMSAADGHVDDEFCLASLVKGGRCRRRRTHGNYCKQHNHEIRKPERQQALWESVEEAIVASAARWEEEQLNMAVALSMTESAELQERRLHSRKKIDKKLKEMDLEACPTPPDGNCQFLALTFSAGIPCDVMDFRQQVVSYVRSLPQLFSEHIASRFRSFDQYCDAMARDACWGDELTLQAASHLLLRRVVVVSDSDTEPERIFEPPPGIAKECWGPDVYIAHVMQNHFEATSKILDAAGQEKSPAVKQHLKTERP